MDRFEQKKFKKQLRHRRVRAKISGTSDRPRLSVFRSGRHIYAQVIDDIKGITLASASDLGIKGVLKSEKAEEVGKMVAKAAITAGVKKVSLDRGGFRYHGRIKSLAEAARAAGLEF